MRGVGMGVSLWVASGIIRHLHSSHTQKPNQHQPGFSCFGLSISSSDVCTELYLAISNIIRQSPGKSYLPAKPEGFTNRQDSYHQEIFWRIQELK